MEGKFSKYYGKLPILNYFGIVLYPYFRLQRLKNILRFIDKNMNLDYVGTHLEFVSRRFTEVYWGYEEEKQVDARQSPVHIPIHAFESPMKQNWSTYEDDAQEAVQEAGGHHTPPGSQGDELDTYLRTGMVIDILQ